MANAQDHDHDGVIDNQGFPAFRADMNNLFMAIIQQNSKLTAPTTTHSFMWWYDRTNDILKMRNRDNDAWIDIAYFDQANDRWEIRTNVIQSTHDGSVEIKDNAGNTIATFDDNGNVGVALVPPSSHDLGKILSVNGMNVFGVGINGGYLGFNSYHDGADFKYQLASASGLISFDNLGGFSVRRADAGSADDTISYTNVLNINSDNHVGIGTTTVEYPGIGQTRGVLEINGSTDAIIGLKKGDAGAAYFFAGASDTQLVSVSNPLTFGAGAGGAERMRLQSVNGDLLHGKTSSGINFAGIELRTGGEIVVTRSGGNLMELNRLANDGVLINFRQAGVVEGAIQVSGTTVSYLGGNVSRWSRLMGADPTSEDQLDIRKGTVMSNLDEMIEWRHVEIQVPKLIEDAVASTPEIPAILNEEGEVAVPSVPATEGKPAVYENVPHCIPYHGDKADGETHTVEHEGVEYEGVVGTEQNEQLNYTKVSDVEGDKDGAGLFVSYDTSDPDNKADIVIAQSGDVPGLFAPGTVVKRGDLLISAGDGTLKAQADDVVRSSTLAKVMSTTKTHVFDDGQYHLPCAVMIT